MFLYCLPDSILVGHPSQSHSVLATTAPVKRDIWELRPGLFFDGERHANVFALP